MSQQDATGPLIACLLRQDYTVRVQAFHGGLGVGWQYVCKLFHKRKCIHHASAASVQAAVLAAATGAAADGWHLDWGR